MPEVMDVVVAQSNTAAPRIAGATTQIVVASPRPMHRDAHADVPWTTASGIAIVLAIVAFGGGIVAGRTIRSRSSSANAGESSGTLVVSWFWFAIGVGALLAHALFVARPIDESWAPDFDTTALFWAIFAVSGFLVPMVPIITDVSLPGGFGFKLARDVRTGYLESTDLLREFAKLTEAWAVALNALLAFANSAEADAESVRLLLLDFLRGRSLEAIDWVGSGTEERRLALWIYDEKARVLRFLHSNEITDETTLAATFSQGEGLLGAAFANANHPPVNVPIAWKETAYKRIRSTWPPKYNGLLLLPIRYGERKIGMLSVDRTASEPFPETQVALFAALAAIVGAALEDPRVKALLDARF